MSTTSLSIIVVLFTIIALFIFLVAMSKHFVSIAKNSYTKSEREEQELVQIAWLREQECSRIAKLVVDELIVKLLNRQANVEVMKTPLINYEVQNNSLKRFSIYNYPENNYPEKKEIKNVRY